MLNIGTVAVIGLGTMGAGIAEVIARSGFNVVAVEMNPESLEHGRSNVVGSTSRAVKRGKLTDDEQESLLGRITFTCELADLAGADLVIEAIPERLQLKAELFAKLDQITGPGAILATNTSSLSVTDISVATTRPAQVVGLHFFNPAPVQAFVEVVRTVITSDQTVEQVQRFAQSLGKQPVVIGDKAGFIANALLFGYLNHAVSMFEQKNASREDIDTAMKLGCGYPMGPLALLDLIGLDTAFEILDTMYKQGRDRLHAPAPMLKQMVTAGMRGRKSGRGFYTYEEPNSPVVVPDALTPPARRAQQVDAQAIRTVGVIGSGTMATGIAETFARGGYGVVLVARSEQRAQATVAQIQASLGRSVSKEQLTADQAQQALQRITTADSMFAMAPCELVIEAVVEDLSVKQAIFTELATVCSPHALLATTTSSLAVVELASAAANPERVVGMHFFNPVKAMKLVEVVQAVSTSQETVATAVAVVESLGKHPVVCGDRAGFIVNALLFPYLNDAVRMVEANYASADDIDLAMKRGCGLPMGPFELLDVVGLDVALEIQRTLYLEFREPGFAPAPRLEHLVTAGYTGVKSGRGFRPHGQ